MAATRFYWPGNGSEPAGTDVALKVNGDIGEWDYDAVQAHIAAEWTDDGRPEFVIVGTGTAADALILKASQASSGVASVAYHILEGLIGYDAMLPVWREQLQAIKDAGFAEAVKVVYLDIETSIPTIQNTVTTDEGSTTIRSVLNHLETNYSSLKGTSKLTNFTEAYLDVDNQFLNDNTKQAAVGWNHWIFEMIQQKWHEIYVEPAKEILGRHVQIAAYDHSDYRGDGLDFNSLLPRPHGAIDGISGPVLYYLNGYFSDRADAAESIINFFNSIKDPAIPAVGGELTYWDAGPPETGWPHTSTPTYPYDATIFNAIMVEVDRRCEYCLIFG